jgi:hypothetical protein
MSDRAERPACGAMVALVVCATATLAAAGEPPRHVGAREDLKQLTLVKAGESHAVIRFGKSVLEMIALRDRLGSSKAVVKEIAAGRLVLEETFRGSDGLTNHAQIILKDGETGGTRYLRRSGEPQPAPATRPLITQRPNRPNPR